MSFDNVILNGVTDENGFINSDDWRRAPRKKAQPTEPTKIERLLSIAEAEKETGISRHRIDAAINSGELAYYPIGKVARKLKVSDILKWVESKRTRVGDYRYEN